MPSAPPCFTLARHRPAVGLLLHRCPLAQKEVAEHPLPPSQAAAPAAKAYQRDASISSAYLLGRALAMEASNLLVLACFLLVSGRNRGLQLAARLPPGQPLRHALSREAKPSGPLSLHLFWAWYEAQRACGCLWGERATESLAAL